MEYAKGVSPEIANRPRLVERLALYRERRRRGARELGRLKRSDVVLFSPGNSGRTWLRVMLTRVIEQTYDLSSPPLVSFDNLRKLDHRIPAIAVTHNRWLPYFRRPRRGRECAPYYSQRVLMLVRNPIDTCVSQYFQWKHRSKDTNVALKGWPPRSSDLSLQDFLAQPRTGVEQLCAELATWLRESHKFQAVSILRYEDMLVDPATSLRQAVEFLSLPVSDEVLSDAVDYGSFGKMKQREMDRVGAERPDGVPAMAATTADGHKTRAGKIGGYQQYLSAAECEYYAGVVAANLPPAFGYSQLPEIHPLAT